MTIFADSSAVVKLYADESGHQTIRDVPAFYVSEFARVEVPAALWRKQRMGELDLSDCSVLVAAFEDDYFAKAGRLVPAKIRSPEFDHAARLVASHGLRAYDGMQLACALRIASVDSACVTFAAFGGDLRQAASREGFVLLPANL